MTLPKWIGFVVNRQKHLYNIDPTATLRSGLPDGLFPNRKSQFGKFWEGLRLEIVDIFYGHWEYFMDIWDIL
jgi:hypothetical protein